MRMEWKDCYKFEPIEKVKHIGESTDKVETCKIYERTMYFAKSKGIKKIIDFAKSWLYYPKMQKYLIKTYGKKMNMTRLQYSIWHCKLEKLVKE